MCRTAGQTMLVATHDATVLAAVDRVIDMAEVNRCEARAGVGGA